jgi:hypothetical protein
MPHAAGAMLAPPLTATLSTRPLTQPMTYLPALRINLLSRRDFIASQDTTFSQSSLPQQHVRVDGGSGDGTREKLVKAVVRSSIVVVAWWRLLFKGDSGVVGRETLASSSCVVVFKGTRVKSDNGEMTWLPEYPGRSRLDLGQLSLRRQLRQQRQPRIIWSTSP